MVEMRAEDTATQASALGAIRQACQRKWVRISVTWFIDRFVGSEVVRGYAFHLDFRCVRQRLMEGAENRGYEPRYRASNLLRLDHRSCPGFALLFATNA
jgi:hypothetical protein